MQFSLEIESDHTAFAGDEGDHEVARILRLTGDMVTHGGIMGGPVIDPDGNTIGMWRYRRGLAARRASE